MTGIRAAADVDARLASCVDGFSGYWAAYILPDAVLLHDVRSDKLVHVTPAFLSWLLERNVEPGQPIAQMLGIDAA